MVNFPLYTPFYDDVVFIFDYKRNCVFEFVFVF